jgi:hypothetical protein
MAAQAAAAQGQVVYYSALSLASSAALRLQTALARRPQLQADSDRASYCSSLGLRRLLHDH